ncbi:hypothetical protein INP57_01520 [Saccharopolyspora sp. HNM0986]|uniref:hypothetical protein n=1 Tax=Saccharopolyspora galaxeae TaxID=2781241 RepID=UPI00190A3FBA|nr:hypothetical protein [Saccharopolyspora sp. HNM0986]MBK0865482.1 hypothetical protein [Saccharopolyspora sp. HNM0986]
MTELDMDGFPYGLADCESPLEEWERLSVRDYWEAVISEELGAPERPASPQVWSVMGSGERVRLRRYQRRAGNAVLRLVTAETDSPSAAERGEAA